MHVEEGQVLARLDDTNAQAALDLAVAQLHAAEEALAVTRAELAGAEKELARVIELSRREIASASDFDSIDTRVRALKARLDSQSADSSVAEKLVAVRKQDLEDTVVRAPFAGIAVSKNAQPGEMISPISAGGGFTRTGISTIVDMTSLEIEVDVNESYINRVRTGQRVESILDAYPEWKIPGKVIAVIPTADRQKATVRVRVGFDQLDPRMLPQMGIKVAFHPTDDAPARDGVMVPKAALRKLDSRDVVFTVRDGVVTVTPVSVGVLKSDEVLITDGLSPGDRVIVEGPTELHPGQRVRDAASPR
jgi:RND family efflux transporter MFP subunit